MTICILLSLVALVISWGYEYRNCELTFLRDTVYIIEYVEIIGCSNVVTPECLSSIRFPIYDDQVPFG